MTLSSLRIATRKSRLACVQAEAVGKLLMEKNPNLSVEYVEIVSEGCFEKNQGDLKAIGGKGLFVKALQQALLEGKADIAVHSMKDFPTDEQAPEELVVPAVLPRADRRDVIISKNNTHLATLKDGTTVGTSSPRRAAQLKHNFPHLFTKPLRGNVETRIQKMNDGEVDAIILAKAGLDRLGLSSKITDVLEPDILCPAAGQGIVGMECRAADGNIIAALEELNHTETFTALKAERAMLTTLQADCYTAVGGYAEVTKSGENIRMIACVAAQDGSRLLWSRQKMPVTEPISLGKFIANDLLQQGAEKLLRPKAA